MDKTIITPCYECNDRTEDCHCICEKYKAFEKARNERYEERKKLSQQLGDICHMHNERKRAWYRASKERQRKRAKGIGR